MSDEEDVRAEDTGPSEAQLAMQKRRQVTTSSSGLDDESKEMLEQNKDERSKMEEEIQELRERSEKRKRERAEEEKQLAERRKEEDYRRKAEEEERKMKKEEEERAKREQRSAKMAEFEKWKIPPTPNFVISKKDKTGDDEEEEEEDPEKERKSKEQLETEKRAILAQRVQQLQISGFDAGKLTEKAKELHNQLYRLESEKYDLEKRFKIQQYDMMELAERARQMNKVGKQGSLKRIQLQEDESDKIQERFAGCPSKIKMFSDADRQKDIRTFGMRRDLYVGPIYGCPAERVAPNKVVAWNEEGLPIYTDMDGAAPAPEGEAATEAAAPPEPQPEEAQA